MITEDGRQILFVIAGYYRQYKERLLGKRYMAMANKQILDSRNSKISITNLDIEDKVLDDVQTKTKAAIARKARRNRSRA